MKVLGTEEAVRLVEQYHVAEFFDTPDLPFRAFLYRSGEVITSPLNPLEDLLILVRGSVRICQLEESGEWKLIADVVRGCGQIFGDMEFACETPTSFFTEAVEECVCIALSMEECGERLHRDVRFLHRILRSMGEKVRYNLDQGICSASLEERLLSLFQDAPNHSLTGIEGTAQRLRCSRRQLQRVLKKMCEEGTLRRTGRGQYRMV